MKFFAKLNLILSGIFLPAISFAQEEGMTAFQLLGQITHWIGAVVPIIIGIGVLVFLWGVILYVLNSNDAGKAKGRTFMLWGIIALFVMVSVWGLVRLLQNSFLGEGDPSRPPEQSVQEIKTLPENNRPNVAGGTPILDLLQYVAEVIARILPILILLGVLLFLVGVLRYAFSKEPKDQAAARNFMLWGIIALTVMVAVWGFVRLLQVSVFRNGDPSDIGSAGQSIEELRNNPEQNQGGNYGNRGGINDTIAEASKLVNMAIPPVVSLGILLFIWGVLKYITTENSKKKAEASAFIMWGIIVLLIMGVTWGFVNMIAQSVGVSATQQPNIGTQSVSPQELIKY